MTDLERIESKLDMLLRGAVQSSFTLTEAAEFMKIAPRTIRAHRSAGLVQCVTLKPLTFTRSQLEAYRQRLEELNNPARRMRRAG